MHILYSRAQRRRHLRMCSASEAIYTAVYALDTVPIEQERKWGSVYDPKVQNVDKAQWRKEL